MDGAGASTSLDDASARRDFAGTVEQISVTNKALTIVATAFVIVDETSGVGILAFRGTEPDNMINWLTDADSAKYAFGRRANVNAGDEGIEYVHSGFYANVEAVFGQPAVGDRDRRRRDAGHDVFVVDVAVEKITEASAGSPTPMMIRGNPVETSGGPASWRWAAS